MYNYRVKYSGIRKGEKFSDTLAIRSPYNLNESYTDASYVIHQIRYELQKITKQFEILNIEVNQPFTREELEPETVSMAHN